MIASDWQQVVVADSTMRMRVSIPPGSGPFAALVVVQHQGGIDEFVQHTTRRLAEAGYVAAAPDLYHRDGPDCKDDIVTRRSRLSDRRVTADVDATAGFLQRHDLVDGYRLGIIGFCMGGRLVYLMAAVNPVFQAAVAYYPGNTFRAWGKDIPSPFERSSEIHCPLLGHFGEEDQNPTLEDMRKLETELSKHRKAHEFYSYPSAGHAFMDHTKESYRRQADEKSWQRTLEFLHRHLGPGVNCH
jgi:carboxymethylenebutenolidase